MIAPFVSSVKRCEKKLRLIEQRSAVRHKDNHQLVAEQVQLGRAASKVGGVSSSKTSTINTELVGVEATEEM